LAKIKCSICSYQLNIWYTATAVIDVKLISRRRIALPSLLGELCTHRLRIALPRRVIFRKEALMVYMNEGPS